MDRDSVQGFSALRKTLDMKVNLYSKGNAAGEGEEGAAQWNGTPLINMPGALIEGKVW